MGNLLNKPLVAGRYELFEPLGSGGAGTVFRARVAATGEEVALKLVPSGDDTDASYGRLVDLAPRLGRVRTPHVVAPVDFGRDETGGLFVVSELVRGEPLDRELVTAEDMSPLDLARSLLAGLAAAHDAGCVHLDLKPANVLVGSTETELFILDFGVAPATRRIEIDQALGSSGRDGIVWGTPQWMAPEQLGAGEPGPASDVYAAALLLLDVLGAGPLFGAPSLREELRARVTQEPSVAGRVPPPLVALFEAMLARDPARRLPDARAALAMLGPPSAAPQPASTVARLSSSPPSSARPRRVSSFAPGGRDSEHPTSIRSAAAIEAQILPVLSELPRTLDDGGLAAALAGRAGSPPALSPFDAPATGVLSADASLRIASAPRPQKAMTRLAQEPMVALGEVLSALDLPMLDALARRERGGPLGRVARAIALSLRIELDAAALLLEPLAAQHPLARAVGASLVAPCARRVTRARVDGDATDGWTRALEAEPAVLLASAGAVLGSDAPRAASRSARLLERAESSGGVGAGALLTLRIATACVEGNARRGAAAESLASALVLRDTAPTEAATPLDRLLRALAIGTLALGCDPTTARLELDRARRLAQDAGATLFEVVASARLGRLLAEVSGRGDALVVVDRAATLVGGGDAPVLEHELEASRSAALLGAGRTDEAATAADRARAVAKDERSFELEAAASVRFALARLAGADPRGARKALDEIGDVRLGTLPAPIRALGRLARALASLGDEPACARELAEVDVILGGADPSREAEDLARVARVVASLGEREHEAACVAAATRRFEMEGGWGFHWLDVARGATAAAGGSRGAAMNAALDALAAALEPVRRADRRTSIPPA